MTKSFELFSLVTEPYRPNVGAPDAGGTLVVVLYGCLTELLAACVDRVLAVWRLCADHMLTICRPHADHMLTVC